MSMASPQHPHHPARVLEDDSAGQSNNGSPSLSMPGTPPLSPHMRGRKRVGFNVSPGENDASPDSPAPASAYSVEASHSASPPKLQPPTLQLPDYYIDPAQLTQSLTELSSVPPDQRRPKSALRRSAGAVTPDARFQLDLAGISDLPTKEAAYEHARARASGLERDVASAPGSRSHSPRRKGSLSPPYPNHQHRRQRSGHFWSNLFHHGGEHTGQNTPEAEELEEYFPRPGRYRTGGLTAHLLTNWYNAGDHSRQNSLEGASGATTPTLVGDRSRGSWFSRSPRASMYSINDVVRSTASTTALAGGEVSDEYRKQAAKRPTYHRAHSSSSLMEPLKAWNNAPAKKKIKIPHDITIKKHIEESQIRRRYILKLCRALMEYGAPTHRLEAYMTMTSRVLAIEAQFLYFPGTMIISFDDSQTHTAEMKLVRVTQGVNLAKMKDTHNIYKDVVHDIIGVQEAMTRLEAVSKKKNQFPVWAMILAHGFGAATIAPVAFEGRPIDLPIAFGLGCILGALQLLVATRSDLYSSVFEIAATILTSFLSRFFGSLQGGKLFCFSALTQSSIVMILPGFTVLSAALELQSRSLVAGSVRIVYAVIYSLWLGYGITIGVTIYGVIDHNATSNAQCQDPLANNGYWIFLFVPAFTMCLMILNQAKWKQMPVMMFIAFAGYQVNYWSSKRFSGNAQVASTLGALAIGVLANLYSRMGKKIDQCSSIVKPWIKKNILHRKSTPIPDISTTPDESEAPSRKQSIGDTLLFWRFRSKSDASEKDLEDQDSPPESRRPSETSTAVPGPLSKNARNGRVNYALAAAAMLPAIFVQVPSGISVTGSLVQGIQSADQITNVTQGVTVVSSADIVSANGNISGNVSFTVASSVVQIAIGITVGLFIGSIVVYPTGKGGTIGHGKKSRSGLFTF